MAKPPQNFQHHARVQFVFHRLLVPVLAINILVAIILLLSRPGWYTGWEVVMAVAFFVLLCLVRINPIKVQDRVIRLEERLRLATLLPDPERARIPELTEQQLIALRFASDKEIPSLVRRTLNENLGGKVIKSAIAEWRADNWRV